MSPFPCSNEYVLNQSHCIFLFLNKHGQHADFCHVPTSLSTAHATATKDGPSMETRSSHKGEGSPWTTTSHGPTKAKHGGESNTSSPWHVGLSSSASADAGWTRSERSEALPFLSCYIIR